MRGNVKRVLLASGLVLFAAGGAAAADSAVSVLPNVLDRLVAPLGLPPGPTPPELLQIQRATRFPFLIIPPPPTQSLGFKFDPELGRPVPSGEGFGSLYGLRPDTLGAGRFAFAVLYTYADYDRADGTRIKKLQIGLGEGLIARVSATVVTNAIDVKATYGLLDDLDLDIDIPIVNQFVGIRGSLETPLGTITARDSREVTGVADILIATKYRFYHDEQFAFAARLELSLPSGREDDVLSVGTIQVNPCLIASVKLPFSIIPHLAVGFRLSGDTDKVAHQFFFVGGLEWSPIRRLSLGVDIVGTHIIDNDRPGLRKLMGVDVPPLKVSNSDILDVAVGFKANPWRNLVVTAGVLIPLNSTGIRAQVVPTVGVELPF